MEKEIVIASGNKGKIKETFRENAIKKAMEISKALNGKWCIADDSGIEIECLNGFPGVKTKRWLNGTDRQRNLAIIDKLKNIPKENRKIKFITAIALSNGKEAVCTLGILDGYVNRINNTKHRTWNGCFCLDIFLEQHLKV